MRNKYISDAVVEVIEESFQSNKSNVEEGQKVLLAS